MDPTDHPAPTLPSASSSRVSPELSLVPPVDPNDVFHLVHFTSEDRNTATTSEILRFFLQALSSFSSSSVVPAGSLSAHEAGNERDDDGEQSSVASGGNGGRGAAPSSVRTARTTASSSLSTAAGQLRDVYVPHQWLTLVQEHAPWLCSRSSSLDEEEPSNEDKGGRDKDGDPDHCPASSFSSSSRLCANALLSHWSARYPNVCYRPQWDPKRGRWFVFNLQDRSQKAWHLPKTTTTATMMNHHLVQELTQLHEEVERQRLLITSNEAWDTIRSHCSERLEDMVIRTARRMLVQCDHRRALLATAESDARDLLRRLHRHLFCQLVERQEAFTVQRYAATVAVVQFETFRRAFLEQQAAKAWHYLLQQHEWAKSTEMIRFAELFQRTHCEMWELQLERDAMWMHWLRGLLWGKRLTDEPASILLESAPRTAGDTPMRRPSGNHATAQMQSDPIAQMRRGGPQSPRSERRNVALSFVEEKEEDRHRSHTRAGKSAAESSARSVADLLDDSPTLKSIFLQQQQQPQRESVAKEFPLTTASCLFSTVPRGTPDHHCQEEEEENKVLLPARYHYYHRSIQTPPLPPLPLVRHHPATAVLRGGDNDDDGAVPPKHRLAFSDDPRRRVANVKINVSGENTAKGDKKEVLSHTPRRWTELRSSDPTMALQQELQKEEGKARYTTTTQRKNETAAAVAVPQGSDLEDDEEEEGCNFFVSHDELIFVPL